MVEIPYSDMIGQEVIGLHASCLDKKIVNHFIRERKYPLRLNIFVLLISVSYL